ncbi:MAG: heteropolysaccharide repeat-containing protein [uncultured bacterium]|nr:MAG: heteropolysaccharide repeat-containing protein [uncultured bacterium]
MSLLRQIAHNTALQFSGKIIGTAIGFVVALLTIRYLGDEGYGNMTTAISFVQLFAIVMDLGLYVVLLKQINSPANADGRLQNNIFSFRAVTAVAFLLIASGTVWLIPQYPVIVQWGVVVIAANFFFITMNQLWQAIFQQHFAMGWVALAEVASKLVLVLSTVSVIYLFKTNVLYILAAIVVAGGMQSLVLWLASRRYTKLHWAFDWVIWKKVLRESWPIAIAIAFNLIYFKSDTIILSFFHAQAIVGVYGVPYKMLEVLITVPAMLVGLLMPVLSQRFQQHDHTNFVTLYQRAINLLWIMAAPLVVGGWFLAQPLMLVLAGEQFTDNPAILGQLFRILILAVAAIYVGTLTGYVVVVINKQRAIIGGYAFVAVTALAGYLWLIPTYSYFGAAWVTVYSELMMVIISLWIIYRATQALPAWLDLGRITLATIIMGIGVYYMQTWPLLLVIIAGGLLYGGALLVLKGITVDELKTTLWKEKTSSF